MAQFHIDNYQLVTKNRYASAHGGSLTKNEITFGPISILFCTKSLLKAQK